MNYMMSSKLFSFTVIWFFVWLILISKIGRQTAQVLGYPLHSQSPSILTRNLFFLLASGWVHNPSQRQLAGLCLNTAKFENPMSPRVAQLKKQQNIQGAQTLPFLALSRDIH